MARASFPGRGLHDRNELTFTFHLNADCPDEAKQFARNRDYDLRFGLASSRQPTIASCKSQLCLPSDRPDLIAQANLALAQRMTQARAMAIVPSCLDDLAPQMCVAPTW